jgi:hypothetical protein
MLTGLHEIGRLRLSGQERIHFASKLYPQS